VDVTDEVKNSEPFKTASPKGESPALLKDSTATLGLQNILSAIASDDPFVIASESDKKETEKLLKFIIQEIAPLIHTKDNKITGKLHKINKDLLTVTFFLGGVVPSVVDIAFYFALHPVMQGFSDTERASFCNITRWFDYVQHYGSIHDTAKLPLIKIKKDINPALLEKPKQEKQEKQEKSKETDEKTKNTEKKRRKQRV